MNKDLQNDRLAINSTINLKFPLFSFSIPSKIVFCPKFEISYISPDDHSNIWSFETKFRFYFQPFHLINSSFSFLAIYITEISGSTNRWSTGRSKRTECSNATRLQCKCSLMVNYHILLTGRQSNLTSLTFFTQLHSLQPAFLASHRWWADRVTWTRTDKVIKPSTSHDFHRELSNLVFFSLPLFPFPLHSLSLTELFSKTPF